MGNSDYLVMSNLTHVYNDRKLNKVHQYPICMFFYYLYSINIFTEA